MTAETGQNDLPQSASGVAALPDSPDPLEIAMDEVKAGADVNSPAFELLAAQCKLLTEDVRHRRLQIRSERMLIGLRSVLALAVLLVISGAAAMVWGASRSRGLVVESFHVPPSLGAQGLTGEVVAGKIVDRLTEMRGKTKSTRAVDSLESDWRNQYRVEIPQTGIAIGDVRRALRQWLGHDTHIGGDVFRVGDRLGLTVRTDRGPSATFEGAEAQLDTLAQQAAEDVYAKTNPYLYATYLTQNDRGEEGVAALKRLAETATDDQERAWGYNGWGQQVRRQGKCAEALPLFQESIRLDPYLKNPRAGLSDLYECLGHDQPALDTRRRLMEIESRADQKPDERERQVQQDRVVVAMWTGDYAGAHNLRSGLHVPGTSAVRKQLILAGMLARAHDTLGAAHALNRAGAQPMEPDARVTYWNGRIRQHVGQENWAAAVIAENRLKASTRLMSQQSGLASAYQRTQVSPLIAVARGRSGDLVAARELVARMPTDCYPCLRARAQVAEIAGNRREADRWFAEALRQGPRLPFAYAEWGQAKLERGDIPGAIPLFEKSTEHGPRFADPFKLWGDALARQGKDRDAVRKYALAADRAPRWGELYLDWGLALQRTGNHDQAREKLALASRLNLPASDRPRLQHALQAAKPGAQ